MGKVALEQRLHVVRRKAEQHGFAANFARGDEACEQMRVVSVVWVRVCREFCGARNARTLDIVR